MRYKEFIEGIRMGARDLSAPVAKQYTVGFEFEVAVDSDFVDDNRYDVEGGESDFDDAWADFEEQWYQNNSFDFDEWFSDNYLSGRGYQKNELLKLINEYGIEPRFGMVTPEDQAEVQNRKERQRLERVKNSLGNPELFDKVIEILNRFESDPTEFSRNMKDVVDLVHLYYIIYKDDFSMSKEAIETKANEIIEKYGFEGIERNLSLYHEHMKKYFTYNESDPSDYEESVEMIFTDEDKSDIIELDDINSTEDFVTYFTVDVDELRDYTQDSWSNAESELMNQEFNDWYNSRSRSTKGSKISYVTAVVDDEFNTRASNAGSGKDKWAVIEDGTPGVDAEITTPAFPIDKGIAVMRKMLNIIDDSSYMRTSSATGLHVNIGTFTEEEADRIDWLKFLMIMNAERVLQRFDRVHNTYAPDKLPSIINNLQNNDIRNYMNDVQSINSIVRSLSEKYSAVNLSKLRKFGIIELRAPGNKNYETQVSYLEETIRRIVRALELASDPNKYKKEYLSMLYKQFGKVQEPKSRSAVESYFINTFGTRIDSYDPLRTIVWVIKSVGSREGVGLDRIDPNKGYTLNAHRQLMNMLDYVTDASRPEFVKTILDALNKYDKNNVMRNSKMINLMLKDLGKN
jgi:hypothetical protein